MKGEVTLDKIIAFLRVYLMFAFCWPLPANATNSQRLGRDILRYVCLTNSIGYSAATIWTMFKSKDDVLLVMRLGCQLCAAVQIPLQIILFAMQHERLQFIVAEMEDYYRRAQRYEKKIFQRYVDKCKLLYGTILCWLAMTAFSMILAPLYLPQSLPGDARYPFELQGPLVWTIVYGHQILTVYQSITQVASNVFSALLLWFVAARFDILSADFRTVRNVKELIKCTREHYSLLRYAKEVTRAVRYVALLCVSFSTGAVMFGCLIFMSNQPWSVKCMFFMIGFCGFVELYMYAWPADNIMSMSSDIASAVYDSLWYYNNPATQRILIFIIMRSQRPITISIPCALPNLSMNYYASYISTVFSYMTLVRVMMGEE